MGQTPARNRNRAGLSLLELILAMTMLGIVILAGTHLDIAALRMTNTIFGDMAVQNDLLYLVRIIEKDLMDATKIEIQPSQVPTNTLIKLTIAGQDIFYTFSMDANSPFLVTINRKVGAAGADQSLTTNTPRTTLQARMTPAVLPALPQPMPPIEIASRERIIKLNLAAQNTTENSKLAVSSGVSKSILLRGTTEVTSAAPPP